MATRTPQLAETENSFDKRLLHRVHRLKIRCSAMISQHLAGTYDSALKGEGIEFEETRPYIPGDDLRTIDWRVTARLGAPFVKRYRQERQLKLHLLVDRSGSMQGTGRSPYDVAVEVAALLALLAVSEGDRVGLSLFSDRVERTLPPASGMSHAMRILRELLASTPRGDRTHFKPALERLCRVERRRCVIVLLSDFLGDELEKPLRTAAAQHQILPMILVDEADRTLPPRGLIRMRDRETSRDMWIDANSQKQRQRYFESATKHIEKNVALARSLRLRPLVLSTHADISVELQRYFERARQESP